MILEKLLYTLLSGDSAINALVGDRINPTQPPTNENLPYITYGVQGSEITSTTDGPSPLEKATLQIEAWCLKANPLYDVLEACKALMHGYRGGNFRYIKLESHQTEKQERGYSGSQQYSIWWTDANTIPTATSNLGRIETGTNSITLEACNRILTLNCDGLELDGEPLSGGGDSLPDQSGQSGKYLVTDGTDANWQTLAIPSEFARTDLENNFSVEQHFQQDINCPQLNGGGADFTASVDAVGGFFKNGVEIQNFDLAGNHSFTGAIDFQGQVAFTDTASFFGQIQADNINATGSIDAEDGLSTAGDMSCGTLTCYGNGTFSGDVVSDGDFIGVNVSATNITADRYDATTGYFKGGVEIGATGPQGDPGESLINIDGGSPSTVIGYSGIIDGGNI